MSQAIEWNSLYQLAALADRIPRTDDSLHAYISGMLGFHIPRIAVCPGHQAPFDVVKDAFFRRHNRILVLAGRGCGKTQILSILNLLRSKFYPRCGTGHYAAVGAQGEWGYNYMIQMKLAPQT